MKLLDAAACAFVAVVILVGIFAYVPPIIEAVKAESLAWIQ